MRDGFGVPHIYGSTRAGAMFGEGYATAEDRLFFMDALRHAGRAQLSSFAGGSNAEMDRSVWADTPYNESELQQQYDRADELYGPPGILIQNDVQSYVAGVNKFIDEACANPLRLPGEYDLIDPSQSICLPGHEWKVTDVISIAALVAGIFGKGGGGELDNALALEAAQRRFGERQVQVERRPAAARVGSRHRRLARARWPVSGPPAAARDRAQRLQRAPGIGP